MTVLLVTNPTKDSGYAVTGQAAALLHELGVAVVMAQPVFESKVPTAFCLRKKPTAKPISSSPSAVTVRC